MQLDPKKRYLLSRPRGGFNDIMVQVEKSRLYAAKYDRVLVLDTSRSGLREAFHAVFDPRDSFGCTVISWDPSMTKVFDAASSVRPAQVCHQISSYETDWKPEGMCFADRASGFAMDFDHSKDHPEHVLVYEQAGGGYASLEALKRVTLKPEIASSILSRLTHLGSDYDAVHIRHSDYETDYEAFLTRLRPILRGRRVLICSDSFQAKNAAASILHTSTTVLSVSDIPDLGGRPLYCAHDLDERPANISLLSDLIAMSCAKKLFFTKLSGGNDNGVKYSGFSLLAYTLQRHPETVKQLFSACDPVALKALFAKTPNSFTPIRWLHFLNYYRWNFGAERKAFSRTRRAGRRKLKPEKIGPRYHG